MMHRLIFTGVVGMLASLMGVGPTSAQSIAIAGQTGDGNVPRLMQSDAVNTAWIGQTGEANAVSVEQIATSGVNQTTIQQTGTSNGIHLLQDGSDNSAELIQIGDGNRMTVLQQGAGNNLTWSQQGQHLAAPTVTMSGGTTMSISQTSW